MTTSDTPADGQAEQKQETSEAAVRRVLGYPIEGEIKVAGHYGNGKSYVRQLYSFCSQDDAGHVHGWLALIGRTWVRMLVAAGVPVEGPTTVFRCPCVEAAIRVYLVEQLDPATCTEGYTIPEDVLEANREVDYRVENGMNRYERQIDEIAGHHFPAAAIATAAGLRVGRAPSELDGFASRLIEHARTCRLPYPVNIVVRPLTEAVGDA